MKKKEFYDTFESLIHDELDAQSQEESLKKVSRYSTEHPEILERPIKTDDDRNYSLLELAARGKCSALITMLLETSYYANLSLFEVSDNQTDKDKQEDIKNALALALEFYEEDNALLLLPKFIQDNTLNLDELIRDRDYDYSSCSPIQSLIEVLTTLAQQEPQDQSGEKLLGIQKIILTNNELEEGHLLDLIDLISLNLPIKTLDITKNPFSIELLEKISQALDENSQLIELKLDEKSQDPKDIDLYETIKEQLEANGKRADNLKEIDTGEGLTPHIALIFSFLPSSDIARLSSRNITRNQKLHQCLLKKLDQTASLKKHKKVDQKRKRDYSPVNGNVHSHAKRGPWLKPHS